jgi:hypothetical protein
MFGSGRAESNVLPERCPEECEEESGRHGGLEEVENLVFVSS